MAVVLRLPAPRLPLVRAIGKATRGWRHPVPPEPAPSLRPFPAGAAGSARAQPSVWDGRVLPGYRGAGGSLKVTPRPRGTAALLSNATDERCPWGLRSSMEVTPALGVSGLRRASAPSGLIPTGQGEERGGGTDS